MKKIKRILSVILICALALAFVSCTNKEKNEDEITLKWFIPTSEQADQKLVMEKVSEITKEKIGVSLEIVFIDAAAYTERMNMNMASGNDFDICFTGYVNPYIKAVDNGGLLPLDDLLEKEAPELYKALPEYAWEIARVNGEIFAVPNLQGFAPPSSLITIDELTEKYGFDMSAVKKTEDIEPFLKTIKENEPELYPYRPNYTVMLWTHGVYEEITSGLGIRCDGSSKEVVVISDTPEYKQGMKVLHDWYKKGYIREDFVSCGNDAADYNAGRYAVANGGWLPGAESTSKQSLGRDITITPITPKYMSKEKSVAAMTAIGRNTKHPVEAIKVIELVNTDPEIINLLTLGIKDKHYTLNEEGKYSLVEGSGYIIGGAWIFGNQFLQTLAAGQEDNVWKDTEELNLSAVKSPILSFVFDTTKVKNIISQIAAIDSEFSTGQAIIDNNANYEKVMEKKKQAGYDELKAEVQRQIDEYWKTK